MFSISQPEGRIWVNASSSMSIAGEEEVLARATGEESYRRIVDRLGNRRQIALVTAPADGNLAVLISVDFRDGVLTRELGKVGRRAVAVGAMAGAARGGLGLARFSVSRCLGVADDGEADDGDERQKLVHGDFRAVD